MRQLRWHNLAQTSWMLLIGACAFDVPAELGQDAGPIARDMRVSPDTNPRLPVDMPRDLAIADMTARDLGARRDMRPPVDQGPRQDMRPPVDMAPVDQGPAQPIYIICGGQRVDITRDVNHCGGCDISCEQGRGECVDKVCTCSLEGAKVCGEDGRCVDARYDPRNCGECGVTCGVGEVCDDGACQCRPGLTLCDGRCVDALVDPFNCGVCGRDCGEGNRCKAGECGESAFCGAQYTGCFRDNRTACVKDTVEQESDLYCRPGNRLDFLCGDECSGNELCIESNDLISPIQCRPYRPARSCDQCPCEECRSDELCRRQILGVQDVTYCVRKP